jgi:hypothetical protein
MSEGIITNNVLCKFILDNGYTYYTHVACSSSPRSGYLWELQKLFQWVLISHVPPCEHCAVCDAVIGTPYCNSCLTNPRQPGSTLCSTCQQEQDDELQGFYDSQY